VRDAPLAPEALTLRRWRMADAAALSRAVAESAEHLRPWMPWIAEEPLSLAARVALIEQWNAEWETAGTGGLGLWVGETIVGGGGLHRRVGPRGLDVGYWVHPAHTRRGHATAAAAQLTDLALATPGIERVEIHNDRANAISARIPRRLGYELVGEIPHPPIAPAETGVRQLWRMDAARWASRPVRGDDGP
jgi:ribosomal-protein-serine acetyltransferase